MLSDLYRLYRALLRGACEDGDRELHHPLGTNDGAAIAVGLLLIVLVRLNTSGAVQQVAHIGDRGSVCRGEHYHITVAVISERWIGPR